MNVLIVDDEPLARERIREFLKREPDITSVAEAANGRQAIDLITGGTPDVVFLDIQMPDLTGFEVLASIDGKKLAEIPAVIFATAYDEYALQAFEVHALDYLLKPFDKRRFAEAFRRARESVANRSGHGRELVSLLKELGANPDHLSRISIKKDERIILVRVDDIHSVEAQGNYVLIRTKDASHLLRETMDRIESKLDPKKFVRVHRSTIVNVEQIKELHVWAKGEYRILTQSGRTFSLSRGYRTRLDGLIGKS
jgi:two-component system LytT family response regulator